jgi:uncharacterized protein
MKYLMLLAIAFALLMLWSSNRRRDRARAAREAAVQTPAAMVRCRVCGVHLPRAEAIVAPEGSYCSHAHYQQDRS